MTKKLIDTWEKLEIFKDQKNEHVLNYQLPYTLCHIAIHTNPNTRSFLCNANRREICGRKITS